MYENQRKDRGICVFMPLLLRSRALIRLPNLHNRVVFTYFYLVAYIIYCALVGTLSFFNTFANFRVILFVALVCNRTECR
mgnify:CR=1 FL=1